MIGREILKLAVGESSRSRVWNGYTLTTKIHLHPGANLGHFGGAREIDPYVTYRRGGAYGRIASRRR